MFVMLCSLGVIVVVSGVIWAAFGFATTSTTKASPGHVAGGMLTIVIGLGIFFGSLATPGGRLALMRFTASGTGGNWLVIDNSGGETMRHWILEGKLVESSSESDGWQFYDDSGLCYVSGDCFVLKINNDLGAFKQDYRGKYNIPAEQEALR
jgi:hypothetical protein